MKLPHDHHREEDIQKILAVIPEGETVRVVADAMKQLGDPARLQIFWILCHAEECVTDIAAMVNMSSPAVAHHLRILKDARLLTARRSGKEVYYKASGEPVVGILHRAIESLADIACPGNENDPSLK